MVDKPIASPMVMSIRSAITNSSRARRTKVARLKPWLAQWFRNRSRASANGPLRCRVTTAGYWNKVSNIVGSPFLERGRSDQYRRFNYVTFAAGRMITAKGLSAGRHIFLETTYRHPAFRLASPQTHEREFTWTRRSCSTPNSPNTASLEKQLVPRDCTW